MRNFFKTFLLTLLLATSASASARDIKIIRAETEVPTLKQNASLTVETTVIDSPEQIVAVRNWLAKDLKGLKFSRNVQIVLEDDLAAAKAGYGENELRQLARVMVPSGFFDDKLGTVKEEERKSFFFRNERVILSLMRFGISGGAALWSLHVGVQEAATSAAAASDVFWRAMPSAVGTGAVSGGFSYFNDFYLQKYIGGARAKVFGIEVGKLGRWYSAELFFLAVAKFTGTFFGLPLHSSIFQSCLEVAASAAVGMIGQGSLEILNERQTANEAMKWPLDQDRVRLRSRLRGLVISAFAVTTALAAISIDSAWAKLSLVAFAGYGAQKYIRQTLVDRKNARLLESKIAPPCNDALKP